MAQEAEKLGFDSVWSAEAWGNDAFTPLAWIGAQDREDQARYRRGSAFPVAPPTSCAMHALTLDYLSNGRFMLGPRRFRTTSGGRLVRPAIPENPWHGPASISTSSARSSPGKHRSPTTAPITRYPTQARTAWAWASRSNPLCTPSAIASRFTWVPRGPKNIAPGRRNRRRLAAPVFTTRTMKSMYDESLKNMRPDFRYRTDGDGQYHRRC